MSSDSRPNDFKAALLAADARQPSDGQLRAMHARLDARLFTPRRAPASRLVTALVVASSVVIGFFTVQWLAPKPVPTAGGFELAVEGEPRVTITREAAIELEPDLVVVDRSRGMHITSLGRTTVRKETSGVRVLVGKAVFEVEKRAPEAGPVRVLVSGGSIEVHGTRFTVTDDGRGAGQVELHEGAIDFRDETGVVRSMTPGEVLRWPVEPEAPLIPPELDELTPLGPIKKTDRERTVDWRAFDQRVHAQAVITELNGLRQKGQWEDAVRLLERELNRGAPDTRERLSFELGLLYTWQLKDTPAACAHWHQHRREYPEGRFDLEVQRALLSLGCAP